MAAKLVSFPRLNGSNYDNWSFRIQLLMVKEGCWSAAKEKKPEPVTEAWKNKGELPLTWSWNIAKLTDFFFGKLNDLTQEKVLDDHLLLLAILFSSLPEEDETLVAALEAIPDEDLTLHLAKGKFLDVWQR